MVTYLKGDITLDTAECLVNTVNCKGVMGAGVALAFKARFDTEPEAREWIKKNEDTFKTKYKLHPLDE